MPIGVSARTRSLVSGAVVGVSVGIIAAALAVVRPEILERTEHSSYDIRARAVMDRDAASKDIVLIDIAEHDIENAETNFDVIWPWPRSLYGSIATYCKQAGAKVVVFDWLFQDRGIGMADDEDFAGQMREAGNVVIGLALTRDPQVTRTLEGTWVVKLRVFADAEAARIAALQLSAWNVRSWLIPVRGIGLELWYGGKASAADAIATWQRVSSKDELAALFAPEPAPEPPPGPDGGEPAPPAEPVPRQLTAEELATEYTIHAVIRERDGVAIDGDFPRREGMDPPLAIIAAAPARMGNVYQQPEADGIQRRHSPLIQLGGRGYPSLALAAYLVGHPGVVPAIADGKLVLGDREIALDGQGRFTIRYHGTRVYPHVSSYSVLRSVQMVDEGQAPEIPHATFKDKYVIVTATGQALRDLRATPVAVNHLGAEIQANSLDNMLAGTFVTRAPGIIDGAICFVICVLISGLMIVLWRRIRRPGVALISTAAVTAAILIGYFFLAQTVLGSGGYWIAVAVPTFGGIASAFTTLLALSAVERRGKRFVQEALGRYTSTALVRELMEHPEHLSLEWGDRREMSVYFSDIAGFTTISEGLSPEDLVALLNDYLTSMTDLVLEHGGVVDKYIGDAVMAFWGAPLPDPNHATNAIRCALAMRRKCDELRAGWHQRYGHEVFARAGVNSGAAVVGNMGSKHKYNYTVMGDMVNLAARLEGANKAYGTFLMVSGATIAQVGDAVDSRELDLIAVKGKDKAVTVYEVLDERGKTDPELLAAAKRFEEGLALYRARDFAGALAVFEEILARRPDGPSDTYVERCKQFLAEPPPPDWDGVWRMKEK
jgi:adenylate cyclase